MILDNLAAAARARVEQKKCAVSFLSLIHI